MGFVFGHNFANLDQFSQFYHRLLVLQINYFPQNASYSQTILREAITSKLCCNWKFHPLSISKKLENRSRYCKVMTIAKWNHFCADDLQSPWTVKTHIQSPVTKNTLLGGNVRLTLVLRVYYVNNYTTAVMGMFVVATLDRTAAQFVNAEVSDF